MPDSAPGADVKATSIGGGSAQIVINGRSAVRREIGGVERLAREMALRLPSLRPDRYRVIRPPVALAHRAGHAWEQLVLPALAARCAVLYSPANLAPVLYRRNVVVIHDAAALRQPEAFSRVFVDYQRRVLPWLARSALLLITPSEFSRAEIVEVLGAASDRVVVVPGGVDERFRADRDPRAAAERYGLARPYVLAVGTMSARKNLGMLDTATAALLGRGIDLVLAGSERSYLRGAGGPRRLGYVHEEHLPGLYAGARAFVMPSRYEGFGLPCLEAMASGTPVVAARSGALPETCCDGALLTDPDDANGFAEALLAAACDDTVRANLVEAGRRRAASFPWSRAAALTDAALTGLIERTL